MKTYVLEVIINEGSDEGWEHLNENTTSLGVDEVIEGVKHDLAAWAPEVYIKRMNLRVGDE